MGSRVGGRKRHVAVDSIAFPPSLRSQEISPREPFFLLVFTNRNEPKPIKHYKTQLDGTSPNELRYRLPQVGKKEVPRLLQKCRVGCPRTGYLTQWSSKHSITVEVFSIDILKLKNGKVQRKAKCRTEGWQGQVTGTVFHPWASERALANTQPSAVVLLLM